MFASHFGALLGGSFFALFLSGILLAQVVSYMKIYRQDSRYLKALVLAVWMLDMFHSAFVCASVWQYAMEDLMSLGNALVPLPLPLTILTTALITLLVHSFFTYRIFRLSKRNVLLTLPIATLVVFRLCMACVTTATLLHLRSFEVFIEQFQWVFTLGLTLSSFVDILVTASLFYYLGMGRTLSSSLDAVIDTLLLYALENGVMTCAATVSSTITWTVMSHNFIFMGIHFVIAKLYANSLLTALNTRQQIRRMSTSGCITFSTAPSDPSKFRNSLPLTPRRWITDRAPSVVTKDSVRWSHGSRAVRPHSRSPAPILPQLRFNADTSRGPSPWGIRPPDIVYSPAAVPAQHLPHATSLDAESAADLEFGDLREDIRTIESHESVAGPVSPGMSRRATYFTASTSVDDRSLHVCDEEK